jgi:NAD(P)-dependent dehydrogenase (short-subunit alcohol dehydrogenase family)
LASAGPVEGELAEGELAEGELAEGELVEGKLAAGKLVEGKLALVAGGASGIGQAVVRRLAEHGAAVEFADISPAGVASTEADLRAAGYDVRGSVADLSDGAAVAAVLAAVADRRGKLDALVNSVGIQRYGTVETTTEETWDEVLAVNVRSMFLTAKHALPLLRRAGGGAIVNVASGQAVASQRNVVAYTASKGAIVAMTRAMAMDHADEGIRVNVVLPGSVDTPMLRASAAAISPADPGAVIRQWGSLHPIGRVGRPSEVADACVYLVSSLASFITGAELRVDGGLLAGVALPAPTDDEGSGPASHQ